MIMLPQQQQKNRQFICPCTKAYYSYAALFTHIKQKHNGKAPGQIIKPKPQNKRGRPRKTTSCASPQRRCKDNYNLGNENQGSMTNTINLNHVNTNTQIINCSSPLKSTPGSQFKYYKADSTHIPTNSQIPTETSPQSSLLQHLTHHLMRICPYPRSDAILDQIQAYQILSQDNHNSELLQCLQQFISFCRQCLKDQIVSQIELLLIILLQHVYESRNKQSFQGVKHIMLNDYVDSFFEKLGIYIKRWKLQDQPIFLGLNPMKILVVLYNWINSVYNYSYTQQNVGEDSQLSQ